jgi:cysteine/glycine-rich protein
MGSPTKFGGSSIKCKACEKSVYFVEQVVGPGGLYHKACLKCTTCKKVLEMMNVLDNNGSVSCKTCYAKLNRVDVTVSPKRREFGDVDQILSNPSLPIEKSQTSTSKADLGSKCSSDKLETIQANERLAVVINNDSFTDPHFVPSPATKSTMGSPTKFGGSSIKCKACEKSVYFVEQVVGPGGLYHKACLKCTTCKKVLEMMNVLDNNGSVSCKTCHAKLNRVDVTVSPKRKEFCDVDKTLFNPSLAIEKSQTSTSKPDLETIRIADHVQIPLTTDIQETPILKSKLKFGGSSVKCYRCDEALYMKEQVMGPAQRLYHKTCLSCQKCSKVLELGSVLENKGEPYCKTCHSR